MRHKKLKWTMFVITAVGNFIAMLDSTTVNLALYPMARDLHVTMGEMKLTVESSPLSLKE